ncbi:MULTISPECIES: hypothetical protein [Brucella/Ochrobactrum group]|jgi:hypothetical protein|uniref:hypothetical protein n=1 Tax=Brucella/Ochrobactrum group TaxID=2826938 RepID=UPI001C056798|nr:hypothetical protein [Brucella sp. NBRC 12950]QWK81056.1 hypothetical protein KMS41_21080 [Ochrobactrum sp. BTU1]
MSSSIHLVNFHISNRILNQMMAKAGYVTARMKPLPGPLFHQSNLVLHHFMSGVMRDHRVESAPFPEATAAYGTP